jgi:hypothetical protein
MKDNHMKTMIAKYAGRCAICGTGIAKGDEICFFGRGQVEHRACTEQDGDHGDDEGAEDEAAGLEPGTLANDRRLARNGIAVLRSGSSVVTQNRRGRCEDAPCCGCCS